MTFEVWRTSLSIDLFDVVLDQILWRCAARDDGSNHTFGVTVLYFRIEDGVPESHLLRLIDRHIDFAFVRETLKASYSHTGQPSIDLRILLIGYLYGSRASGAWLRTLGCTWLLLVYWTGLRSRGSAPLYVFKESARPFSRIPAFSRPFRASRSTVHPSRISEGC